MSDHFALLGLPPRFNLDRAALDAAYRALQAEVHPDKFANADAATQRQAMERATLVNEAYATLKAPVGRGRYLLQQAGIDAFDPANTRMPAAFLLQQIDWRERLEAALAAGDYGALEALETEIAARSRAHEAQLAELLDTRRDYAVATDCLRELRFLEKLGSEIQEAFARLDG